jgi:VWFA-related protein
MNIKAFLALLLVFSIFFPALAQNKPVTNLTAADFEIFEDGKRQTITSFSYISNVSKPAARPATATAANDNTPYKPLNPNEARRIMAIVVDDLGLSFESMYQVKRQLRKFVAENLEPDDLVAIIRTGRLSGALQQFTNDKRLLNRAMDQLRWNSCSRVGINVLPAFGSTLPGQPGSEGACTYRSIESTITSLGFIVEAMGQLPGRKSLVLLSDALPTQSQDDVFTGQEYLRGSARDGVSDSAESSAYLPDARNLEGSLQRIAERAIRNSVVIYSVDTQGVQDTGWTAADNISGSVQERQKQTNDLLSNRFNTIYSRREGGGLISKQTGGFQVHNSNSYEFDRILEDQSGYYLLGYRPTDETFNRRFHHIKAKVKKSGMSLRTRYGFFGVSEEEVGPNPLSPGRDTNLALASPFGAQDIEVNLASFFTNDKVSGLVVRSFVYIDAKDLKFENVEDRHQASIELHGVIFGDNGKVVEQLTRGATLSLNEGDYEQAMRNGMALRFDMPVKKPGAYQVRVATRDRVSSKIGSAGQFVDVPNLNNKKLAVSGMVLGTTARFAGRDVSEIVENPGTRFFEPNSELHFAFVAYNAASAGNLVMETKLFRDAKIVYSGPETPLQLGNQPDPNRVLINGSVRLSPELELGNYYIQVVITDKSAKGKAAPVVQWIDFDIVK